VNLGVEYVFHDLISLRTGYHSLFERDYQTTGGFTFGGGLQLYISQVVLVLDYAYRDYGILHTVDRLSCSIRF